MNYSRLSLEGASLEISLKLIFDLFLDRGIQFFKTIKLRLR